MISRPHSLIRIVTAKGLNLLLNRFREYPPLKNYFADNAESAIKMLCIVER